jgi:hypothetical protein
MAHQAEKGRDCEWHPEGACDVLRHGLLQASFIPNQAQRELRELTSYRTSLVQERAAEVNRVQLPWVEASPPGPTGDVGGCQYQAIERVSEEIAKRTHPFAEIITLLNVILGVAQQTAAALVAEVGTDMSRFPSADHLASWAGLAPGNNNSGGKRRSGKTHGIIVIAYHVIKEQRPYTDLGGRLPRSASQRRRGWSPSYERLVTPSLGRPPDYPHMYLHTSPWSQVRIPVEGEKSAKKVVGLASSSDAAFEQW